MKLNANKIVYGLKTTKFYPNKKMCFYSTKWDITIIHDFFSQTFVQMPYEKYSQIRCISKSKIIFVTYLFQRL